MTSTASIEDLASIKDRAAPGRRVTYAYYNARNGTHPGIITGTMTAANGVLLVKVRLDGARSPLHMPANQDGLVYLDEIEPVPDLPMGRFKPDSASIGFDFEYDGVLVVEFEDGDLAAVSDDKDKAEAAVATFLREHCGVDDEAEVSEQLRWLESQWRAFEWEPEDAECAWLMNPAEEGDDQAVHVYYLPA